MDIAIRARASNAYSIGIEHVALSGQGRTPAQDAKSIELERWLVSEHHINPANIVGHRFAPGNLNRTDCPSTLFGEPTEQSARYFLPVISIHAA
ncbi:N-acetylmuramoyl-L-alanine amidase [Azospirillum soli]|uniref:N-acetylmuramoyl-L-alanine amidase n=1 Tax=Azospirillum soli TaxID=1304799 RepID=UPI003CCEEEC5